MMAHARKSYEPIVAEAGLADLIRPRGALEVFETKTAFDNIQTSVKMRQRHGVPLGAAALQFPLFHPAFCSVIPGALSVTEVKENVAYMGVRIPVELWSELKRAKLLDPAAPTPN